MQNYKYRQVKLAKLTKSSQLITKMQKDLKLIR